MDKNLYFQKILNGKDSPLRANTVQFKVNLNSLHKKKPNGCQIRLNSTNYGNFGQLDAYFYTDSSDNEDYATFEKYPNELVMA